MTKKYYWTIVIALAFVAGTMVTGSIAYAHSDPCSKPASSDEVSVWHVLCDLRTDIDNIDVNDADSDPTNELQTISLSGQDLSISGGNTVTIPTTELTTYANSNVGSVDPGTTNFVTARCDPGDLATGGGVRNFPHEELIFMGTSPSPPPEFPARTFDGSNYIAGFENTGSVALDFTVFVICLDITP